MKILSNSAKNEARIEFLITQYQQRVFSLVLSLIGGDKTMAYDITVSCFIETIRTTPLFWVKKEDIFLIKLAAIAVKKCRDIKPMPFIDEVDFVDLPLIKRKSLQLMRRALSALPFDEKVLLLLRDQIHLSYQEIAAVFRMSEKDIKIQMSEVRSQLRKKMEEVLGSAE